MATKRTYSRQLFPLALGCMGVALALLSFSNITGHSQVLLNLNQRIVNELSAAGSLPVEQQIPQLVRLRDMQDKALSGMPSEPFAWARFSYLRLATVKDQTGAFDALRVSNLVSPDEPRQLPERAIMWRQFGPVESLDEKDYQAVLWQKAFRMQADQTWNIAKRHGLTKEVGAAIEKGDRDLYEDWKARAAN